MKTAMQSRFRPERVKLTEAELAMVGAGAGLAGQIFRAARDGVIGNATYDALRSLSIPSASSSTRGFGVVGPGSLSNTNPSSVDAVNGSDRESDDAATRQS